MAQDPEPLPLGCSKCRYSAKGCSQCRNPNFKGRRGARPKQPIPAVSNPAVSEQPAEGGAAQNPAEERLKAPSAVASEHIAHREQTASPPEAARKAVRHSHYFAKGSRDTETSGRSEPLQPAPESILATAAASPQPDNATELAHRTDTTAECPSEASASCVDIVSDGAQCNDGSQSDVSDFRSKLQDRILQNKSSPRKLVLHTRRQDADSSKPARKRIKVVKKAGLHVLSGDPKQPVWDPPASPFGLIEEVLYQDPWRLLLACMLLNKTSGTAVRRVIWELFKMCPDAATAAKADVGAIERLIYPLGLATKRAAMVVRFSAEYLDTEWTTPMQLHGIGQYATDAYFMFCRGEWRQVQPLDKDLLKYHAWLVETDGHGSGLQRDTVQELLEAEPAVAAPDT